MWARLLAAAAGIWLMAAPAVLAYGDPAAMNDRIVGPVAASFAIIAIWEATRPARWVQVPLGLWLVVAAMVLDYPMDAMISSIIAGLVLIATAVVRGKMEESFDGGWSMLWRSEDRSSSAR